MTRAWEPLDEAGVHSPGAKGRERDVADLVEGVRRGDADAFEQLVREVGPRLYKLAVHLTARREDAEDLVQETLVRALPALRRFEGRARLSTYLVRTLSNLWKNRLRSRSRSRIVEWLQVGGGGLRDDPELDPPDRAPSAEELLQAEDRAVRVREAMKKLAPDRRLTLLLREVEGLSYEEIASITGVAVGTVRSRLARAREDLRRWYGGSI